MKRTFLLSITVFVSITGLVSADSFGTGANQFDIDFVPISGDSDNLGSWDAGYTFSGVNHGDYRMGTYEITNDQWNKFLNSYGTVTGSPSNAYDQAPSWTGTNVPTNRVSWYEAAQFTNWLNTSTGKPAAYKFTGAQGTGDYKLGVWESGDAGYNPSNPYRNSNAIYFLPTENEWVKAAYWNGTSLQIYTNASAGDLIVGVPDSTKWNYSSSEGNEPWGVGSGGSEELNGTYDMMGNVWEWMESPYISGGYLSGSYRGFRGGSYNGNVVGGITSRGRLNVDPVGEFYDIGFRVASVPEPCSLALLALGGLVLRRRR